MIHILVTFLYLNVQYLFECCKLKIFCYSQTNLNQEVVLVTHSIFQRQLVIFANNNNEHSWENSRTFNMHEIYKLHCNTYILDISLRTAKAFV